MICPAPSRPVSLRVSLTERCQLRCIYCAPARRPPMPRTAEPLGFEEILRFVQVVKRRFGLSKVHLTGGEPLVRPGVSKLVGLLTDEGVSDLALTTNGQRLAPMAAELRRAGLRRINISLDSLNGRTFARLTRGGKLEDTIRGLQAVLNAGLKPVKINVTVLRGVNSDEVIDLAAFALAHDCQVRFLELMALGPAATDFDRLFVPSDEIETALAGRFELRPMPAESCGSTRWFSASESGRPVGRIGFISPTSQPFCDGCSRLRLTASGQLIGCLRLGRGADLRSLLQSGSRKSTCRLVATIRRGLDMKRRGGSFISDRLMSTTGG